MECPFLGNDASVSTEAQNEIPHHPLESESVDIDPEGDVIFECGRKRLRVSSTVIGLASSSFRTVISARWSPCSRSSNQPLKIDLHEDDPEAFTLLFQTLHFVKPSDRPQLAVLEQFAIICDTYLWIMDDDTSNSSIPCKGIESLLTITYIFGLASEFSTLSGRLASLASVTVRSSSTEIDVSKPLKLHPFLPYVLQDDILRLRDRLMKAILETIELNLEALPSAVADTS